MDFLGFLRYKPGPMSGSARHHGHQHPTPAGSAGTRLA